MLGQTVYLLQKNYSHKKKKKRKNLKPLYQTKNWRVITFQKLNLLNNFNQRRLKLQDKPRLGQIKKSI